MRTLLAALASRFHHVRIVPKLLAGYVLLICIPFSVFGFIFYKQMYDDRLGQYRSGMSQLMEQAYRNLEVDLTKVEAIYPLFQNNTNLTEYLGGVYATDWDMVYEYKKEIGPTFSFAYIGNQLIEKITVYKNLPEVAILSPEIEDRDRYSDPVNADAVGALPPNRGLWTYEDNGHANRLPTIRYIHKMYNDSFSRELGLLQLTLNDGMINQFFKTLQSGNEVWRAVTDRSGKLLFQESLAGPYKPDPEEWASNIPKSGFASYYSSDGNYLICVASLERWNLAIMNVYEVRDVLDIRSALGWPVAVGILLLCLLSLLYYTIASSIAMRIIRFSRHMRRVEDPKRAIYSEESGSDEIGFLISAYNAMMHRVDELSHVVTQTELLKKEAEIKMLQAQINPHFLYNTLETMRMLALMKGDDEVAEIGLKLGKLLRYSLSKAKDETTLSEELENVGHYIDIHRLRMGERLHAELAVQEEALGLPCPRFILQPIVENSILHGFENIRGKGTIRLELRDEPDAVIIRLSDNGAGIPEEKLAVIHDVLQGRLPVERIPSAGGIGLYNVHERIKAYYGGGSGMSIHSSEGLGTVTVLRLEKAGRNRIA